MYSNNTLSVSPNVDSSNPLPPRQEEEEELKSRVQKMIDLQHAFSDSCNSLNALTNDNVSTPLSTSMIATSTTTTTTTTEQQEEPSITTTATTIATSNNNNNKGTSLKRMQSSSMAAMHLLDQTTTTTELPITAATNQNTTTTVTTTTNIASKTNNNVVEHRTIFQHPPSSKTTTSSNATSFSSGGDRANTTLVVTGGHPPSTSSSVSNFSKTTTTATGPAAATRSILPVSAYPQQPKQEEEQQQKQQNLQPDEKQQLLNFASQTPFGASQLYDDAMLVVHAHPNNDDARQRMSSLTTPSGIYPPNPYNDNNNNNHDQYHEYQNNHHPDTMMMMDPYSVSNDNDCTIGTNRRRRGASCCCLWQPFVSCIIQLWTTESIQRSICYGAIDGMLTGAGIVATFGGLQLLTALTIVNDNANDTTESSSSLTLYPNSSWMWFIVLFCWTACTADAVCMAMGHVWSTHVLTTSSCRERNRITTEFQTNRADCKGKLVDLLLARGMLKIDAMSIADTLEGYPDIFIGALLGGHVVGVGGVGLGGGEDYSSSFLLKGSSSASLTTNAAAAMLSSTNASSHHANHNTTINPNLGKHIRESSTYRSYGQFNEEEHDPDAATIKAAVREARREATAMMLAFSFFGGVPALVVYLWTWIKSLSSSSSQQQQDVAIMNLWSASIITTSIIMLGLGAWKSTFFESHWIIFGIETVVVLLVCISVAYGLGFVLIATLMSDKTAQGANEWMKQLLSSS